METLTTKDHNHSSRIANWTKDIVDWAEEDLFDYLRIWYFPDLEMAKDKMSHYDCFSRKHRVVIELKCRRHHYDELILEKWKYDKLSSMNWKSIYVNSTPLGVFAFKIDEIDPNWITDKKMPHKTDYHIFRTEKEKTYTLLHISKAKQI